MRFIDLLQTFYAFLLYPQRNIQKQELNRSNIFALLLLHLFVMSIALILMTLLLAPLMKVLGLDNFDHAMDQLIDELPKWKIFIYAVIIGPILEEFIFRYLLKFRFSFWLYPLSLVIFAVVLFLHPILSLTYTILLTVIIATLLLILIWDNVYKIDDPEVVSTLDFTYFPYAFYSCAVIFAFVHAFNFNMEAKFFYLIPLLVIIQFSQGLLFGFTRLQFGMKSNILLHMFNNLIPMTALLLGTAIES